MNDTKIEKYFQEGADRLQGKGLNAEQSNAKELPSLMPLFLNMTAAEIRQLFFNLFEQSADFAYIVNNAFQTWDAMRAMQDGEPEGTLKVIQEVNRANP